MHVAADEDFALRVQPRHAGMRRFCRAVDVRRLVLAVIGVLVRHVQQRQHALAFCQRHLRTDGDARRLLRRHRQRDRDAEWQPIGEAHVTDDGLIVLLCQEARQRTQAARRQHFEVGKVGVGQRDPFKRMGAFDCRVARVACQDAIDERAAVGGD
jgi:hypothetical protein